MAKFPVALQVPGEHEIKYLGGKKYHILSCENIRSLFTYRVSSALSPNPDWGYVELWSLPGQAVPTTPYRIAAVFHLSPMYDSEKIQI